MPAKDFSKGAPRPGQWVVLDDKHVGIACGPDLGLHGVRFGRDGEFHVVSSPPPGAVLKAAAQPVVVLVLDKGRPMLTDVLIAAVTAPIKDAARPMLAGFFLVDLVDPKDGLVTTEHLLVHGDRIAPLTDRGRIPAKRLSTMAPSFQPVP
jgi:hypothetical protein